MELYIGGQAQGKLTYVLGQKKIPPGQVLDGETGLLWKQAGTFMVFNHFHSAVRELLKEGKNPEEWTEKLLAENPDLILISNETGNGIVPMEPFEREYRERLGRILCTIAQQAERVERILCGMGQRIK